MPQISTATAERDSLASQNATLAHTTNQLMTATADVADASGQPGTQVVTSAQMKEIGNLLQRLTRENAAILKQRDKLTSQLESLTAETDNLKTEVGGWGVCNSVLYDVMFFLIC